MKTLTTLAVWTLAATGSAADLNGGLVTAVDRVGGKLLGPAAFDAVLFDPQPEPPRLRLFLSEAQSQPVEIVLLTAPGETDPPDPVRAYFRLTVGGPERLKLEFDPQPGEIVPCIEPPVDLSGIALPPADSGNGAADFRAGLVTALGEVGKNLLGAGRIDAVLFDPQPDPPRLRLFLSRDQASLVEIVVTSAPGEQDPPEPVRPFFRMLVGGEEVELHLDDDFGSRTLRIEDADLSSADPPEPV